MDADGGMRPMGIPPLPSFRARLGYANLWGEGHAPGDGEARFAWDVLGCTEGKRAMGKTTKRILATTLGLVLTTVPLVACAGQDGTAGGTGDASATDYGPREITGSTDVKDWKTVADAYAGTSDTLATSYDDTYYIGVYEGDGKTARIVVKLTPEASEKLSQVDYSKSRRESDDQVLDAIGKLPLEAAEDLTKDKISDEDLRAMEGKTGKDLIDDGFVFEGYSVTGGKETGALLAKGSFNYLFMFDCETPAETPADDGETIMDAKVTSASHVGISGAATNPVEVLGEDGTKDEGDAKGADDGKGAGDTKGDGETEA